MNENNSKSNLVEPLSSLTCFSRTLILILFILLPFIGFWLGLNQNSPAHEDKEVVTEENIYEQPGLTDAEILIKYIVFRWPEDMPDLTSEQVIRSELEIIKSFTEEEGLDYDRVWPLVQLYLRDYGPETE